MVLHKVDRLEGWFFLAIPKSGALAQSLNQSRKAGLWAL